MRWPPTWLVDDWHRAWRWFSTQAMALTIVVVGGWSALPQSLQDRVPEWLAASVAVFVLACGIVGRLVKQPGTPDVR